MRRAILITTKFTGIVALLYVMLTAFAAQGRSMYLDEQSDLGTPVLACELLSAGNPQGSPGDCSQKNHGTGHCFQHCSHAHGAVFSARVLIEPRKDSSKFAHVNDRLPAQISIEPGTRPPNC